MPDSRIHRGPHPEDIRLFAAGMTPGLREATAEYAWLLERAYAVDSALKLVGDRHNLTARQRLAIRRVTCPASVLDRRLTRQIALDQCAGRTVAVDGYNLLITIESALSGGPILIGLDGCHRDLASLHGTYRKVEETVPALRLIRAFCIRRRIGAAHWYLDRPVSNSGRLRALMADLFGGDAASGPSWSVELVDDPDAVLAAGAEPVVSSDSVILDRCTHWVNLAAEIVAAQVPQAWVVDLRSPPAHS
jgi:hypothetical protein